MKVNEIMDMIYLVNKFEDYLRNDLDEGDDHYDIAITNQFKEVIQSKIIKRAEK
jgi:hypothetical protein